ncbi:MAG: hypothetical protein J0I48_21190 [Devosia sp.]|jgi:hypothetical protein|uniref:hypothetical protein n=1 Tax=unclassified Devosia TaxID=196773 RepID=UPI00092B1712|nr:MULTISPECIES: hypothetical protein [unclassified Devosia]MBL8599645.1 hypothetical protein [Devosia sp.]MBN9348684.1 hypothetical protein [Devosia sp.]OJX54679.1 MAG: hypothetical protein BGO81_16285 [Devosia sp. 66-22]
MSARKMVQSLRDSGALAAQPAAPPWRTTVLAFFGALALGAGVYLGALYGLPLLAKAMTKVPPPVTFAKPSAD